MAMAYKIGLIGTHSSGKTTLAKELTATLPDSLHLGSVARDCPLPINENASVESELWIMSSRMRREIDTSNGIGVKYLVCERTVLDDVAYLDYVDRHRQHEPYTDLVKSGHKTYTTAEYVNMLTIGKVIGRHWLSTYHMLFYLEPLKLESDDVRSSSQDYQDDIDSIIQKRIVDYGIPVTRLAATSLQERLAKALTVIEGYNGQE